jgi:uncharacterized cupredoxin-like copper-binding protein
MTTIRDRLSMKILLPLLLISIFSVATFAASVTVSTTTYQNESGVYYNVTGGYLAASNGFYVAQESWTQPTQPVAWTSSGTDNATITYGQWYYSITLTIQSNAATSTTTTVTVQWKQPGSGYTQLGQLSFTSPSTITAGQTMTFLFSTGSATFTAPAGIVITVQ